MTVQDFCVRYGFQPTRVARTARFFAQRRLDDPEVAKVPILEPIDVREAGMRVRRQRSGDRLFYEIYDEQRFFRAMLDHLGYRKVLSESQVRTLIAASDHCYTLLHRQHEWEGLTPKQEQLMDRLYEILPQIGISNKPRYRNQ